MSLESSSSLAQLRSVLTVAGSDSGGQAGIQADLNTFAALGVHGCTAITCLTAQNPIGLSGVRSVEPEFVAAQLRQVLGYYRVCAVKTGMLYDAAIIRTVVDTLTQLAPTVPLVVDPVMVASSGELLLKEDAIRVVKELLLPAAMLLTPNLDEAQVLANEAVTDLDSMMNVAQSLSDYHATAVLLKGGHLDGASLTDILCQPGKDPVLLHAKRNPAIDTHGSGCTLSAAITAQLALGKDLEASVRAAHRYLQNAMHPGAVIAGRSFIYHGAR